MLIVSLNNTPSSNLAVNVPPARSLIASNAAQRSSLSCSVRTGLATGESEFSSLNANAVAVNGTSDVLLPPTSTYDLDRSFCLLILAGAVLLVMGVGTVNSGVCNAPLLLTLLDRTLANKLLEVFSRSLLLFSVVSSSTSRLWSPNAGKDLRAEAERAVIFPSMCLDSLDTGGAWCIELSVLATRLRTGGGDNALTLDMLPNLDLGDSESPAEELEEDDGATELRCQNEMGRVL